MCEYLMRVLPLVTMHYFFLSRADWALSCSLSLMSDLWAELEALTSDSARSTVQTVDTIHKYRCYRNEMVTLFLFSVCKDNKQTTWPAQKYLTIVEMGPDGLPFC